MDLFCVSSRVAPPDEDKIKVLMTRKVPSSKKDLKSFLGALTFYSQLIPLAGDQISCLYRMTRGGTVVFRTYSVFVDRIQAIIRLQARSF